MILREAFTNLFSTEYHNIMQHCLQHEILSAVIDVHVQTEISSHVPLGAPYGVSPLRFHSRAYDMAHTCLLVLLPPVLLKSFIAASSGLPAKRLNLTSSIASSASETITSWHAHTTSLLYNPSSILYSIAPVGHLRQGQTVF